MKNTSLITWAVALSITIALGLNALNMTTNASQGDVLRVHEGKLGGIEAKLERIPIIEGKLDTILEQRGFDPRQIESIVEQRLSLLQATTT